MPDPPQNLDINKTLIYLLHRVAALEGGGDVLFEAAFAVVLVSMAASTAVDSSGAPASDSEAFSVTMPSFADSTAVDAGGAPASTGQAFSPAMPSFAVTTLVIP